MNQPIYDELRDDGILDYHGRKKTEFSCNNSPLRSKNGLNSTVDSGFETGEWLQNVTQDALKPWNDQLHDQTSKMPEKKLRDTGRKSDIKNKSNVGGKSKTAYYDKIQKDYVDHISAYDASSENEVVNNVGFPYQQMSPSPSPHSSNDNEPEFFNRYTSPLQSELNVQSSDNVRKLQISDGKLSVSLPNCNVDFTHEPPFKKSHDDILSTHSSQMCLADELKQALIEAQMQLNPDSYEPSETLSERIAAAVQKFVKTRGQISEHNDSVDNSPTRQSLAQTIVIDEPAKIITNKSTSSKKKNENKKDHLSTEFEATEIEYEHCKQVYKAPENFPTLLVKQSIHELSEEKNSLQIDSDQSDVIDDTLKDTITSNLAIRTKNLQARQDKAKELIQLTQEFKKESKKVKLLEKKACRFSKRYLKDPFGDQKTNIVKHPRHGVIHPNGKDNINAESKDNGGHKLSPTMNEMEITGENDKCDGNQSELSEETCSAFSDVDEPTVSVSEVTTTLTDQSELDAQLVALRAEMSKKRQLVAVLKSRQKEMKRDKIKQKEITLQKQIEMYDSHIVKLQNSIDQISTKADDAVSEDSHTLTGSTTNINDLESKTDEIDVMQRDQSSDESHIPDIMMPTIDTMYNQCIQDYPDINEVTFDQIVDNNIALVGEDVDLDAMLDANETERVEIPVAVHGPSIVGDTGEQMDVDSVIVNDGELDEMVKYNSRDHEMFTDDDLDQMYDKEVNFTVGDGEDDQIILDDLVSQNLKAISQLNPMAYPVTCQNQPELNQVSVKSNELLVDVDTKLETVKHCDTSTEIFIIDDSLREDGNDTKGNDSEEFVPEIQIITNCDPKEITEKQLRFPINYSDDEASSISNDASVKSNDELLRVHSDTEPVDNGRAICITSPVEEQRPAISDCTTTVDEHTEMLVGDEILNTANVELLVDCLLRAIVSSEIELMDIRSVKIDDEPKPLSSVAEILDFPSTCFESSQITMLLPTDEEKSQSSIVRIPIESNEFSSVNTAESSSSVTDRTTINLDEKAAESGEKKSISVVDKQLLSEKIKWLIPLQPLDLDKHIDAAILHFYQARQRASHEDVDELFETFQHLPNFYTDTISVITDAELGEALFNSSKQQSYIDKRIVFHLVREIFSEIYSFERYQPQMPWIHSSFMVKRRNYTTWKGDKPPESYDLVSQIIRERIWQLFNQKNIVVNNDIRSKSHESSSHSKITKWCIDRQKDQVDKILINDLRKEENEWVYYDDAEEEVKKQIAEDVFNFLIIDTISWLRSVMSQN